MVDFDRLKALGNEYLHKAGDLAEQAKEKAGPLVGEAREKAGPLAEKAKDAAAKGVDKAAEKIDSATGGKYSEKIDTVTTKLSGALGKDEAGAGAAGAGAGGLSEPASNLRPADDVASTLSTDAPAPDAAMSSGITDTGGAAGSSDAFSAGNVTTPGASTGGTGGDFATSRDVLGTTSDFRTSGDNFGWPNSAEGGGTTAGLGTPSADYAADDAGVGDVHSAQQSAEVFDQHSSPADFDSTVGTGPVGAHASNLIPPAPQDRSPDDAPAVDDPWDGNVRGS